MREAFGGVLSEGFEVERSIEIGAAPEVVFDVWSRYENFPHFMSRVREVKDLGNGRSEIGEKARALLEKLAAGDPDAVLTGLAKSALAKLGGK